MAARKPWAYLAKGDCLDLMKLIPDGRVDMVLCDLPYGITECQWDRKIALGPLWDHYTRVTRPGGVIALFAQQPFATELAGVAAANARRSFIGIEMDAERFRAAEERIAEAMAEHGICRSRTLWARKGELA